MSSVAESSQLLRHCADLRDISRGRQIHQQLLQTGEDRQTFLGNLLVLMYGKCERPDEAAAAFRRIRQTNIYSWTNLVAALARNGHLDRADSILRSMPVIEVVAWNTVVTANARLGHPLRALYLLRVMDQEGIQCDGISLLGAIEACCRIKSLSLARQLHDRIIHLGLDLFDLSLANATIKMYSQCGIVDEAKRIFDSMRRRDLVSWNTIVAAFASAGDLESALKTFSEMEKRDRATWNTMIVAFSQAGNYKRSIQFLAMMDLEGIEPDEITFLGGLDACSGLLAVAEGRLLHDSIRFMGLESSVQVATSLITMYGNVGDPSTARTVFDRFLSRSRDPVLWNAALAAYARNGHLDLAMDLARQMDLQGLAKNSATHVNLLSGFSHGGTLADGIEVFVSMSSDHGIAPGFKHYSCVIDLLARSGKLDEAHSLLLQMPFHPDLVSWTSLLAACKLYKDPDRAAAVARSIAEFKDVAVSIGDFYVQEDQRVDRSI